MPKKQMDPTRWQRIKAEPPEPAALANATKLDILANEGASLLVELRRHESHRKLSARAFKKQAFALVPERTAAELQVLSEQIAPQRTGLAQACRLLAGFVASHHCSCLPSKADKLAQMWRHVTGGIAGLEVEMMTMNVNMLDVVALGTVWATLEYADSFGLIDDPKAHADKMRSLREQLIETDASMRRALCDRDIIWEQPEIVIPPPPKRSMDEMLYDLATEIATPGSLYQQRQQEIRRREYEAEVKARDRNPKNDRGPWLKRYPSISTSNQAWPSEMLQHMLSADPVGAWVRDRAQAVKSGALVRDKKSPRKGAISRRLPKTDEARP